MRYGEEICTRINILYHYLVFLAIIGVPLFYVFYWYRCYFPGAFNIPLLSPYPTPIDVPPLHIPLLSQCPTPIDVLPLATLRLNFKGCFAPSTPLRQ
jgi:hypothetical protein